MLEFKLKGEYIELIKLLKIMGLAETGGQAKIMIEDGLVKVNGEVEIRKKAKLHIRDIIEVEGEILKITGI